MFILGQTKLIRKQEGVVERLGVMGKGRGEDREREQRGDRERDKKTI